MSLYKGNEKILGDITKVPIASTINESSTNEECAGAKAVYDKVSELVIPLYENGSQCVIEDVLSTYDEDSNFDILFSGNTSGELFDLTGNKLFLIEHRSYLTNFKTERAINAATGSIIAQRSKAWWGAGWSKWEKVCTTKVVDKDWTTLTNESILRSGIIKYRVKNGICFVTLQDVASSTMSTQSQIMTTGLPIPEQSVWYSIGASNDSVSATMQTLLVNVRNDGSLINYRGTNDIPYFGVFSYIVAES